MVYEAKFCSAYLDKSFPPKHPSILSPLADPNVSHTPHTHTHTHTPHTHTLGLWNSTDLLSQLNKMCVRGFSTVVNKRKKASLWQQEHRGCFLMMRSLPRADLCSLLTLMSSRLSGLIPDLSHMHKAGLGELLTERSDANLTVFQLCDSSSGPLCCTIG